MYSHQENKGHLKRAKELFDMWFAAEAHHREETNLSLSVFLMSEL